MLNVTIQNDGKIKFQSECSSTKDMRHNVNLLLAVVSSMEMEEAVAKKEANGIPVQTTYYLYLDKVEDNKKLSTVRTLSLQLNMPIERAKAIVDIAADDKHNILLSQSPDESFINTMKDILESAGCICRITNGF
jgi:hypothetical protein|uniref:L7/L12 50 S RIBOSOMAL protein.7A n=1 Tax=virus sp. ctx9V1 TaxID=2828001 RepID=A0A8S5RD31_9VIRU|nr:MAG TPA: L7/L12 50 S RIBOSOMAL protein.7A [virus sp. ctx9V1]